MLIGKECTASEMSVTVYHLTWCNAAKDLRKIPRKLVALSMLKFVRNRNQNFGNSFPFLKQQKKSTKASVTNFFSHKVGQN
jgi:hypothetical protein